MMDQILDAPQQERRPFEYAGFWIRVAAYVVDVVALVIVDWVLSQIFFGGYDFLNPSLGSQVTSILVGILYFSLMESSENQGTLGKLAVGIKVGDEQGNRISFANAFGRYFSKIISAILLGIGFMMVGWDDRKQGLHDKIADTYVYYK